MASKLNAVPAVIGTTSRGERADDIYAMLLKRAKEYGMIDEVFSPGVPAGAAL